MKNFKERERISKTKLKKKVLHSEVGGKVMNSGFLEVK